MSLFCKAGGEETLRRVGLLSILALTGLFTPAAWGADKLTPQALKKVKAATVHIRVTLADGEVAEGSGFTTRLRGLIVTNAHVIGMLDNNSPKPKKIEVTFFGGEPNSKTIEAKIGYVDGENDLALIAVPIADPKWYPELLLVGNSLKLMETQDVFVVGYPLGNQAGLNVSVTATTVTSLRKEGVEIKRVQLNGGLHHGNSGGPIVDANGIVVGIAVSGFANTQVHLAIATELLNALLNGRIMNMAVEVPYRDGNKIRVPVRFEKADPLLLMKTISMETWQGKPQTFRGTSNKTPMPLPDDSPISTVEFKLDESGWYYGELVINATKEPGKVYWYRYKIGRGGDQYVWYPSGVLDSLIGTPVEREAVTLKYNPPLKRVDSLVLVSDASFRIRESDGDDRLLSMQIKAVLQESVVEQTKDGNWRKQLTYEALESKASIDKKPITNSERLNTALKDIKLVTSALELGTDGKIIRSLPDLSKLPTTSRGVLSLISGQTQQSLDSLSFPFPTKSLDPLDTWKGKQDYEIGALGAVVSATAEVTYTYEGTYTTKGGAAIAVLSFHGPLTRLPDRRRKKGLKEPKLTGQVEGKIEVFTETGLMHEAKELIRAELDMDFDGKSAKAVGVLNVMAGRASSPAPKK